MKPFLKWPGNKYRIVNVIKKKLPVGKRLIEPFAGSGSILLNTDYSRYLVGEKNTDLINLYQQLKQPQQFIKICKSFFVAKNNKEKKYYVLRKLFNQTDDLELKAALFLYLNRHGYNGLCRYNLSGGYNVPFGFYHKPYFPEKEMEFFAARLPKVSFKNADYRKTMRFAKQGDVVYCDPPYVPLSATANFTSYGPFGFDKVDHIELVELAENLAARGIPVIISNHNTLFVRKLYANAKIYNIEVQRNISCVGNKRSKAQEVIAVFN